MATLRVATQFKPGESGNPSGRPKRVRSLRAELLDELGEVMRFREGGSDAVELTKGRAIVKSLVQAAVDGNLRAATALLTFFGKSLGDTEEPHGDDIAPEDSQIVEAYRAAKLRLHSDACEADVNIFNTTTHEVQTMTQNEITLLRNDFLSFASKALFELDGTILSEDGYLEFLSAILTEFADGKPNRLIINAPPRHLKSQLGTVCLIAWILAHDPRKKIILLAGSMSLAETHARATRAIIRASWYRATFPTRIKKGHGRRQILSPRPAAKYSRPRFMPTSPGAVVTLL